MIKQETLSLIDTYEDASYVGTCAFTYLFK